MFALQLLTISASAFFVGAVVGRLCSGVRVLMATLLTALAVVPLGFGAAGVPGFSGDLGWVFQGIFTAILNAPGMAVGIAVGGRE